MLTAIVLTKNCQNTLAKCLASLKFADSLVIIDDFSTDQTPAIARKYNVRLIRRKVNSDFSKQRNYALTKVNTKWSLFVDSDEVVSLSLAKEIKKVIQDNSFSGYKILRADTFLNHKLKFGETGSLSLLRLAQTAAGKWTRPVHEVWQVSGKIGLLAYPLLHYPTPQVSAFLRKINYYSTINARFLHSNITQVLAVDIITYPLAKFLLNYLLKRGYKDRSYGLIHAVLMSFHSFLTRGKTYLLNNV